MTEAISCDICDRVGRQSDGGWYWSLAPKASNNDPTHICHQCMMRVLPRYTSLQELSSTED